MAPVRAGYVKVLLRGPEDQIETPWAETIGDGLFRLDNAPWFAYGVSADDVVEARPTDADGVFEFVRVAEPSGNRTLRLLLDDSAEEVGLFDRLLELGCSYEGLNPEYIAVTVPADVALDAVVDVLGAVQWESANPPGADPAET